MKKMQMGHCLYIDRPICRQMIFTNWLPLTKRWRLFTVHEGILAEGCGARWVVGTTLRGKGEKKRRVSKFVLLKDKV